MFINIVKSNKNIHPNRNSTTEIPAKVVEGSRSHYISWTTTGKRRM
jgi:hypothetical protein